MMKTKRGLQAVASPLLLLVAPLLITLGATTSHAEVATGETQRQPLTLEEALRLASEQSESFQIERELLEQARAARGRAWAAVLPTVSVSGTYTHADREIAFNDRILQRLDSVAGSASATLTLLGGGAIADIVSTTHATSAAEERTRWRETELQFEVARAWFTALASRNLVAVSQRTLATAEEHLQATEARRSAGVVLATEEGRARLAVVEAREGVTRAQNALEGSLDYLAFLIGREPPLTLAEPIHNEPGDIARPELPRESESQRSDLRAAQLDIRAARTAVTSAWMDYLPTIALTGSYRVTQNTGFSGDPASWQILMTLDWLIYDGGLRRATRRERASQLREAQLRLDQLDRSARHQARQARRDLDTAAATLRTSAERVELARVTREQVLRRFRGGVDNSLELVEADDALEQAELSLVAGQLELATARLALLQALGLDPLGREATR